MRRAAAVILALAVTAQAQELPPELSALRSQFHESISAGDRAVHRQFAENLSRLENQHATAGDYDAAKELRGMRESLLSMTGTADGRATHRLDMANLSKKGSGLGTQEASGIRFTSTGAFLEWELNAPLKGWYEIMLTHGVEGRGDSTGDIRPVTGPLPDDRRSKKATTDNPLPDWGGWVGFEKVSTLNPTSIVLHREIVSTGGLNTLRRVSLGRMELNGNLAKFKLTAKEAYRSGLMNFRSLELVPASAPIASTGDRDLEAARKTFSTAFRQGTAEANKTYRESLQRMAAAQKDPDLLVRIRREITRLDESPEKLAFSSDEDDSAGGSIVLRPGSGLNWKLRGDVRLDTGVPNGIFTTLRPAPTASISWRLAAWNIPSGTYSAVLKGRVPLTGGGSAELTAAGPGGVSSKAVEVKINPVVTPEEKGRKPADGSSPPQAEWRTLEPVQIVIPRGAEYITLSVAKLTHADGSLIDVTSLTLTRTGEVPAPKSP